MNKTVEWKQGTWPGDRNARQGKDLWLATPTLGPASLPGTAGPTDRYVYVIYFVFVNECYIEMFIETIVFIYFVSLLFNYFTVHLYILLVYGIFNTINLILGLNFFISIIKECAMCCMLLPHHKSWSWEI